MEDDTGGLTRRGLVAAVGGAGVGGVAGVLYFGDVLGGGDGVAQIGAKEPNDDGEASLGELRYLIEEYDGSEYTVDVTSFSFDEGVIDVRYESAAADQSGNERWRRHLGELGHVVWAFGLYVQNDGPNLEWNTASASGDTTAAPATTVRGATESGDGEVEGTRLTARIGNPYTVEEDSETPAQPSSYGIEREWVRNWIAGAWTEERLINRIANTRVGTARSE